MAWSPPVWQWYGVQTTKGWFVLQNSDQDRVQHMIRAAQSSGGKVIIFDERGDPVKINDIRRGNDVRVYKLDELRDILSLRDLVDKGRSLGELVDDVPIEFKNFPEKL